MSKEKLYSVHVIATCSLSVAVQVDATSEREARRLAKEKAEELIDNGDLDDLSSLECQRTVVEDIREGR